MELSQETELGRLPGSWQVAPLGQYLNETQYGLSLKGNNIGTCPVLRMTNQINGRISPTKLQFVEVTEKISAKFRVQRGDILFNRTNSLDLVGRTAIFDIDGEFVFASYLIRLRCQDQHLDPFFLNLYLNAEATQRRLKSIATRAVSQSNISATRLKGFLIPIPPVAEQRKIAAILWLLQWAIEQQDRLIALTVELKSALMDKLFTEGLRAEPQKQTEIGPLPESWTLKPCNDVCKAITVGVVVRPASHYADSGVPAFRSFNVREDCLEATDLVYFSSVDNDGKLAKSKLLRGDVLIVRTGYPGTSCVVPAKYEGANCIDLVIARPKDLEIRSGFLSRFFNSNAGKRQTVAAKHGLAQQHLNVGAVKRTLVPIPKLDEQDDVNLVLSAVDRRIQIARSRESLLKDLYHTLLHQLMTAQIRVHDLDLACLNLGTDGQMEEVVAPSG